MPSTLMEVFTITMTTQHNLFILLLSITIVITFSYLYLHLFKRPKTCTNLKSLGDPYPIVGHLPQFLANRDRFNDWMTDALSATPHSTLTFSRIGGERGVITANPSNIEHILRSSFDNYPKGPNFTTHLHDFLGAGIFNADGPLWHSQRKTASYEFNTRSLRSFVLTTVRHEVSSRLLPLFAKSAASGSATIDLQDVFERFAFDSVCKVAFGVDPACLADDSSTAAYNKLHSAGFARAFSDAANLSAGRFLYALPGFWKVERMLGVGPERCLAEAIATVHGFAVQIIRSRKKEMQLSSASVASADDLLSRFIAVEDVSEEYLRDIVISFILAGRDTTSSALTWFFWLLSSRPEVEGRIVAEISSIRGRRRRSGSRDDGDDDDEAFEFEELREMQYLHAALTEAMRLYPPVPVNITACMADDVLPDGTEVRKGWFASYNSYAMGRMEGVWGKDCREYRPERWLDESASAAAAGRAVFKPESPFKFPVFHAGPRMCLGKEMAYIQMKSVAACVLERFAVDVRLDKDTSSSSPEQLMSLTLRMKDGLPVTVRERAAAGTWRQRRG